jgi:hypothetical protein
MIRAAGTAVRAVCALTASVGLAGCFSAATERHSPSSSAPAPVTAAVDQFRDDYAAGSIVLQLTDTGGGRLSVVGAALADPRFEDGTAWTGSADLDPGQTTSLPAALAAARCTAATRDGAPSVHVRLADGTEHTVPAADPHAVLPRLHDEQCFSEQAQKAVALRLDDALAPGQLPGTAVLTLITDPPAAGSMPAPPATLVSVAGTTLLGEDPAHPWPRGVVLGAAARLPLAVRPARCDPHAVAEDKVGTLVPVTLEVGGVQGTVKVAASPALRSALYRFIAASCGWPAG